VTASLTPPEPVKPEESLETPPGLNEQRLMTVMATRRTPAEIEAYLQASKSGSGLQTT